MSDCVSVNEVTIRAAVIFGLAIVALVASGWRKTARAQTRLRREVATDNTGGTSIRLPRRVPIEIVEHPAESYRAAGPIRRLWALIASAGLTAVIGAVVATVAGFGIAVMVTVLTDLLKQ